MCGLDSDGPSNVKKPIKYPPGIRDAEECGLCHYFVKGKCSRYPGWAEFAEGGDQVTVCNDFEIDRDLGGDDECS